MPLRAKVFGTAAILGTGSYVSYRSRNPTLMESSPSLPTMPVSDSLSAYDKKEDPMYLIPEKPTELQHYISGARKQTISALQQGDAIMRSTVDHIIAAEHAVERTVKDLKPKQEPFLPGAIYTAIAGLSGSIVSRNRAFPIRFLTPVLFFIVSSKIFIPETSANVGDLIYSWESRVPEVKKYHDMTRSHLSMALWKAGEVVEDAEHMIDGAVTGSKEVFEKNSGIKLPK